MPPPSARLVLPPTASDLRHRNCLRLVILAGSGHADENLSKFSRKVVIKFVCQYITLRVH